MARTIVESRQSQTFEERVPVDPEEEKSSRSAESSDDEAKPPSTKVKPKPRLGKANAAVPVEEVSSKIPALVAAITQVLDRNFQNQFQKLKTLSHVNIIRHEDLIVDNSRNTSYAILENCDFKNLKE